MKPQNTVLFIAVDCGDTTFYERPINFETINTNYSAFLYLAHTLTRMYKVLLRSFHGVRGIFYTAALILL